MRRRLTGLVAIAALTITLGLGPQARAVDLLFTVTGTINNTGADPTLLGYTNGQAVSFFWVLNDYAPTPPNGSVDANIIRWRAEDAGDPVLWANFGGTGLTGNYTPSAGNNPNNYLDIRPAGSAFPPGSSLRLLAGSDSGSIGLQSPNALDIRRVQLSATAISPFLFATPGTLPNPVSYFSDYLGSYTFSGGTDSVIQALGFEAPTVNWTPQTLTIAQVPEPSTYALGGIATGVMAYVARRRKASRKG